MVKLEKKTLKSLTVSKALKYSILYHTSGTQFHKSKRADITGL